MAPPLTLEILQKRVKGNQMDLSSLRLKEIPFEMIWQCIGKNPDRREHQITKINLSNNLLTSLPSKFCYQFPEIEFLSLQKNKLDKLPDNFGNMAALKRLNLAHNQIKKLPNSFAELEDLEWLNLSHNPLHQDFLEIIGHCSNDIECTEAATNAVQYVHFSATLSSESTAINRSAFNNHSTDSENAEHPEEPEQRKNAKRRYANLEGSKELYLNSRRICSSGTVFVLILLLFSVIGIPLWLTLDSMRANCVDENYSSPEEKRFCTDLAEIFSTGAFPPTKQFLIDFTKTFKMHWYLMANSLLDRVESMKWRALVKSWVQTIVFNVKFAAILLWEAAQPFFGFFNDYLLHLWDYYFRPVLQA